MSTFLQRADLALGFSLCDLSNKYKEAVFGREGEDWMPEEPAPYRAVCDGGATAELMVLARPVAPQRTVQEGQQAPSCTEVIFLSSDVLQRCFSSPQGVEGRVYDSRNEADLVAYLKDNNCW